MPGDVELADFGEGVDEEVVGVGVVAVVWLVGFGVVEEGEGDFGGVAEAEEGLLDEVGGEVDSGELEWGFGGVERVVVVE